MRKAWLVLAALPVGGVIVALTAGFFRSPTVTRLVSAPTPTDGMGAAMWEGRLRVAAPAGLVLVRNGQPNRPVWAVAGLGDQGRPAAGRNGIRPDRGTRRRLRRARAACR